MFRSAASNVMWAGKATGVYAVVFGALAALVVGAAVKALSLPQRRRVSGMPSIAEHKAVWVERVRPLAFCLLALLAAAAIGVLLAAKPAHAVSTFTVNNTFDPGNNTCNASGCTLREAINAANSTPNSGGPDLIRFAIPGAGPHTISPGTSLPDITDPVIINGYTQPGANENTKAVGNNADLRIRLDGGYPAKTLAGLRIAANDSVVRGLSITRFFSALPILGTDNNKIEGNFIGTDPGGTQALGNPNSVRIGDSGSNNTIGGTSPESRNIISGNHFGVVIEGTGTTGNRVQGNYIGTTRSGTGDLGNSDWGVIIGSGASNSLVGGVSRAAANIIAFNGETFSNRDGVAISDASSTGNRILGNSIFSNADLGIDLGASGMTPNDGVGDADTGANNLQNFPVLSSAKSRAKTTIKGNLKSTQNETFTIQFFKNPKSTREEGKKFIGKKRVTTGASGKVSFTFKPKGKVKARLFVTATAANVSTGDTSEFSAPKKVRLA